MTTSDEASAREPRALAESSPNGWTGGQYSAWRVMLGLAMVTLFVQGELDADAPFALRQVELASAEALTLRLVVPTLGVGFALGILDRFCAAALMLLLGIAVSVRALHDPESGSLAAGLLIAHLFVARAPYGSLAAAGRTDPAGDWRMSERVMRGQRIGWAIWLSLTYAQRLDVAWHSSPASLEAWIDFARGQGAWFLTWLGNSAGVFVQRGMLATSLAMLLLLPLALWRRAWTMYAAILVLEAIFVALSQPTGSTYVPGLCLRALAFLLFFDPAWIPARGGAALERVFYDGECGLCQRTVRFLLAEDREQLLRFAPLQGETFAREMPPELRANLPDSIVVRTADGRVLTRSTAALHVLQGLGGYWRVAGALLGLVPRVVRDALYDLVAPVRKRVFAAPKSACPLGPRHVTRRFDP